MSPELAVETVKKESSAFPSSRPRAPTVEVLSSMAGFAVPDCRRSEGIYVGQLASMSMARCFDKAWKKKPAQQPRDRHRWGDEARQWSKPVEPRLRSRAASHRRRRDHHVASSAHTATGSTSNGVISADFHWQGLCFPFYHHIFHHHESNYEPHNAQRYRCRRHPCADRMPIQATADNAPSATVTRSTN